MSERPIRREITDLWADCYGQDAGPWLRRLADRLAEPGPADLVPASDVPSPPHVVLEGDPPGMGHWSPDCWCWRR